MLKIFALCFLFLSVSLYGRSSVSYATTQQNVAQGVSHKSEIQQASREFNGCIKKLGFFDRLSSHYTYALFRKDKCIAFLTSEEKVKMPQVFESLMGKEVVVKGRPVYVNRDPYLEIVVEDVCVL